MSINNSKTHPQPNQLKSHAHSIGMIRDAVNNLRLQGAYSWQDDCINDVGAAFNNITNSLSKSSSALDLVADDIASMYKK